MSDREWTWNGDSVRHADPDEPRHLTPTDGRLERLHKEAVEAERMGQVEMSLAVLRGVLRELLDARHHKPSAELEVRQNELHLAMIVVESMPASEAQTACIVKLGERMRRLVELRGKSEVGRSLDV